ncbi:DUF4192 domain-containing protein, partial [Crossiella sp. SN42]|uniref:DUF4192 domain-containing protein n=1 Tax=Crossiella sp. SN42 TaxID=2944808 RepID=UPI00207C3ACE
MRDREDVIDGKGLSELIISVPHLLGVFPTDSVVVLPYYSIEPLRFRWAIRESIADLVSGIASLDRLGDFLANLNWDRAVILIVGGGSQSRTDRPPHAKLVDDLGNLLQSRGIGVVDSVWAPDITRGAKWIRYSGAGMRTGRLADPRSCQAAAQAVTTGKIIHDDLQDLLDSIKPDEGEAVRQRRWRMWLLERNNGGLPDGGVGKLFCRVRRVRQAIRAAEDGVLPDNDRQIVLLGWALKERLIWESSLRNSFTAQRFAAHRLWLDLTRRLPDRHRAEPAALLSLSAALLGQPELAKASARVAAMANPDDGHITAFADHMSYGVVQCAVVNRIDATSAAATGQISDLLCG